MISAISVEEINADRIKTNTLSLKTVALADSIYSKEETDELLVYEEASRKENIKDTLLLTYTPFRQVAFLYRLFFTRKFLLHRVSGLVYLLQYAAAFFYYFADYEGFL